MKASADKSTDAVLKANSTRLLIGNLHVGLVSDTNNRLIQRRVTREFFKKFP